MEKSGRFGHSPPFPRNPGLADNTMEELGEKKATSSSSVYHLDSQSSSPSVDDSTPTSTQVGVVLTRKDYYTVPSISELQRMVEEGNSEVEDLIIGRKDCGEILFPGTTDVNGLDLDKLG